MRITCVGDVGVDKYVNLGLSRPGGCTLNVAVHLSRLAPDFEVCVASALGQDLGGQSLREVVHNEKIAALLQDLPGATPTQSIELLKGGERKFIGYETGVLDRWQLDSDQKHAIHEADVVMTLVYTQLERVFAQVLANPRRGQLVVDFMDLTDYGGTLDAFSAVLNQLDVGIFGLKDPTDPVIGQLEKMSAAGKQRFLVTLGAQGSLWLEGGKRLHAPAFPVSMVVDSTGAGDAFAAAFFSRYLDGASPQESLAFASQHAAGVVTQIGGFPFHLAPRDPKIEF